MCTGKMKNSCYQQVYVWIPLVASIIILINFVVQDRDTKPMVCLSCVSDSWCCTFKKCYVVLASNSCIRNFELHSQCIWFSLAHQPLAGKEGLDRLCYSNCANAKILAGPIRFVDCYTTPFIMQKLIGFRCHNYYSTTRPDPPFLRGAGAQD